jgi:VCBS repeat-containing protein
VGDVETAAGSLTVTGSSDNTDLVPNDGIVFGGSGADRTVTVTPAADGNGQATITVTVTDGDAGSKTTTFTVDVTPVNDAPVANAQGSLSTNEDNPLTGTVTADDADGDTLTYAVATGPTNGTLDLQPDGSFTYTPGLNSNGSDSFTFTANDGTVDSAPATVTIGVTSVNDLPTITSVAGPTINEDSSTDPMTFTVGDVETAVGSLTVTGSSDNTDLVANDGIVFGGSGADRTVTVTPLANANGQATITLTVTDGDGGTETTTFTVDVTSVNDLPTIDWIPLQTIEVSGSTGPLSFQVGDVETNAGALTVTATSSSHGIVLDSGVVVDGTGADRTVTVTPLLGLTGQTEIKLTVTDGNGDTMDTTFLVYVGILP